MGARRQRRIGELLREELSALIAELKDPRVSGVTVPAVEPAPDLTIAKVYVTAWPTDPARREEVLAGLEHAKGYLKHELAGRVILRRIPDLVFKWDDTFDRADRIERLLSKLHEKEQPLDES